MYYYGARYYDPRVSLWMSTEDHNDVSTYCYVFNNPLRFIDPMGLSGDEPDGWSITGNFIKGVGQSLWGTVEGAWNVVRHPINTAQNIGSAVSHPQRTYNAVKTSLQKTYNDFSSGNGDVKANMAGNAVGEIAQLFIGGSAVKAVTKGPKVVSAAKQVSNAEKVVGNDYSWEKGWTLRLFSYKTPNTRNIIRVRK